MLERCQAVLDAGHAAIAEAVFDRPPDRLAIADVAAGGSFQGFWLEAGAALLAARIEARRGDVSDATADVMRAQVARGAGQPDWARLDATLAPEAIASEALRYLGLA
jgi:predicted kinase